MASPDGSDLVQVIAGELAKQVPVKEALSPAAVEIGGLGSDLVKVVRLALAPVQYLAVQQDRYRRFIERAAQKAPEADRVEPAPQLLGPILEGIRYEPEGSMTDEAFAELLGRAFDRERASQAHPSFPFLIRALADDEMVLLDRLRSRTLIVRLGEYIDGLVHPVDPSVWKERFSYLTHPLQIKAYANHLEALGLTTPLIAQNSGPIEFGRLRSEHQVWALNLSDFGTLFASAIFSGPPPETPG